MTSFWKSTKLLPRLAGDGTAQRSSPGPAGSGAQAGTGGGSAVAVAGGGRRGGAGHGAGLETGLKRELSGGSARGPFPLARLARPERLELRIVDRLRAGLAVQMDRGLPAARDRQQVAVDRPRRPGRLAAFEAHDLDRRELRAAQRPRDHVAGQRLDADLAQRRNQRMVRRAAGVDHGRHPHARDGEIERGPIGVVAAREDRGIGARRHGEAVEIGADGARQHDAWPVVVGEGERPLDRPGREHHLAGADRPETLARAAGIFPVFEQGDQIVVVVAERRGARQERHLGQARKLAQGALDPGERRGILDLLPLGQQPAAEARLLVDQDHPRPGTPGSERCREAGRPAADHQDVAMGVALVVAIGIGLQRRFAQARGAPDQALVDPGPERGRPFEGLVVEAGREDRAEQAVQRHQVEGERGPAVLAPGDQPVLELGHGRPAVGLGPRAFTETDQRVRLLGAGRKNAARAMVLEAPADQADAVREQRRGQAVARMALEAPAVEAEAKAPAAVDQAAFGQAKRLAHPAAGSARASASALSRTSWVIVSRVTTSHCRQPRACCQDSR